MTFAGLTGATLTVVVTTLDDAVWLVPYLASPSLTKKVKVFHGLLFVGTLVSLAAACVLLAQAIQRTAFSFLSPEKTELILGAIGASLCWIIALVLFVRKVLKRKRRAEQARLMEEEEDTEAGELNNNQTTYGSSQQATPDVHQGSHADERQETPSIMSPWTVVSLTTLGALDELSYFPALVIGGVFSPLELCVGTLLASIVILLIVTCFLARLQPVVDCFDRIPLYAIVAVFAAALTIETIFDALQ